MLASVIFSSNPLPFIILKYTEIFLPGEALKILIKQIFLKILTLEEFFFAYGKQHTDKNFSRLQVTACSIEVLDRLTPFHETWLNILTI